MEKDTIKDKREEKKETMKNKKTTENSELKEALDSKDQIAKLEKEIESLKEDLLKIEDESKEHYQNYLISLADKENLRKRFEKEKADAIQFSNEAFFKELLPILDSVDKALSEGLGSKKDIDFNSLKEGFLLVEKKLKTILESNGLEIVHAEGEEFDPHLHQAIQKEESEDVTKSMVKEEFMKGYKLHQHLLRPAIVSVFVPKEEKKEDE